MKIVLVTGAVLAVLGAGGLTGAALTAASERPPVADDASQEPADEPDEDSDGEDTEEESGKPDDEAKAARHAEQRAFVAAKQEWTACVGEAAPAHADGDGPFDAEEACGPKPHPHDDEVADEEEREAPDDGQGHGQGRPAWAGGPGSRTDEPPGHAAHDQASKSH